MTVLPPARGQFCGLRHPLSGAGRSIQRPAGGAVADRRGAGRDTRSHGGADQAGMASISPGCGMLLSGNFGTSVRTGLPVCRELLRVSLNTLYLDAGLDAGHPARRRARSPSTRRCAAHPCISWPLTMLGYVISALPVFWLGYLVHLRGDAQLRFFPALPSMTRGASRMLALLPRAGPGARSWAAAPSAR